MDGQEDRWLAGGGHWEGQESRGSERVVSLGETGWGMNV